MNGEYCPNTGKRCYSYKTAHAISKHARSKHRGTNNTPSRCYRCEFCHYWHLTHQKKRGDL